MVAHDRINNQYTKGREIMKYFYKRKHVIFFVLKKSNDCKLFKLHSLLNINAQYFWKSTKKDVIRLLYDTKWENYSSFLEGNKITKPDLTKIIIFGTNDIDDYPLIKAIDENYISDSWFDLTVQDDSIAVFFVPKGACLLCNDNWKLKFRNWISFEDKFNPLIGLPFSEKIGKKMFSSIFSIAYANNSVQALYKEIEVLFDKTIKEISTQKVFDNDMFVTVHMLKTNKLNLRGSFN